MPALMYLCSTKLMSLYACTAWSVLRLSLCVFAAATDGDHGETGDEEQGVGNGKQKASPERGMLKGPGQPHHMRARQNGMEPNAHHNANSQQYYPQQHQSQCTQPQHYPPNDQSPIHYPAYPNEETLTRSPSINMDWQTLRAPR